MEAMDDIDEEHFFDSPESSSDDSDQDPSYFALEEARSKLSNLSVTKKSKPRAVEETDDVIEIDEDELEEEVDEKSFGEVQRIVGAGKIEKLKVEQCKVYLRKNGLRLTGNKAMLIHRIREHLEILNGGGERKYPVSSFFMNCKGDACTGDVVLFEQNVYDTYSIVSRSASGPPCGTRMVAGRIVKESYGAAKQQHTFTVEVLWSKGEKPLPPLHPLLIKGRNLYRLKTLRQKWEDEEERQKKLMEKHARGSLARSNRGARIEEKEKRKMLKANRVSKREPTRNHPEFDSTSVPKEPPLQQQRSSVHGNLGNTENQVIGPRQSGISLKPSLMASINSRKPAAKPQAQKPAMCVDHDKVTRECQLKKDLVQDKCIDQASQSFNNREIEHHASNQQRPYKEPNYSYGSHKQPFTGMNENRPMSPLRRQHSVNNNYHPAIPSRGQFIDNNYRPMSPSRKQYCNDNNYRPNSPPRRQFSDNNYRPVSPLRRQYCNDNNYRPISPPRRQYCNDNNYRPMSPSRRQFCNDNYRPVSPSRRQFCNDNYRPMSPSRRHYSVPQKPCHYYAQGRCYFGESCKYSHDTRE